MQILIAVLLIIVIIFGISSGMQSYATAQQAQAQIETAKVGQIASWGNLVTILTMALLIVVALAVIIVVLWMMTRRTGARSRQKAIGRRGTTVSSPTLTINDLLQFEMLKALRSLNGSTANQNMLPWMEPKEEEPVEDHWLK